jgi:NADH-ubiquinone oxidoreductase chain 5
MISKFIPIKTSIPYFLALGSLTMLTFGVFITASSNVTLIEWLLLDFYSSPLKFTLILDKTGLLFRSTVLFIAINVIFFSKFYIKDDLFINRFTYLVILFVLSINILIFIPHFIILLLGWDGLGITSFILVVYYINPKSLAAGIITALTNRIGDVIILIALGLTLNQGHWNIIFIWDNPYINIQVIIILVAGITKRAQIPFSRWLPAAIAAPTPVSALVHSSTLVTAGVFLLIRFYPFLRCSSWFNTLLIFVAVSTIFIAGLRATTECDIKKIIALSTLSQLGIIIIRLGMGLPNVALFHIITHAIFKALLFICAGELIAIHSHGQELRWIGNLTAQTPVATSCILIANSALCGLPFLAGFYSKDLIIESLISGSRNLPIILLAFIAVGLTSFYSIRFSLSVIWGPSNFIPYSLPKESISTILPICLISIISITCGGALLWLFPDNQNLIVFPIRLKILPLLTALLGGLIGWLLNVMSHTNPSPLISRPKFINASCRMWFLVPLSSQFILANSISSGLTTIKLVDHGWIEILGGMGSNLLLSKISTAYISKTPNLISRSNILSVASLCVIIILFISFC